MSFSSFSPGIGVYPGSYGGAIGYLPILCPLTMGLKETCVYFILAVILRIIFRVLRKAIMSYAQTAYIAKISSFFNDFGLKISPLPGVIMLGIIMMTSDAMLLIIMMILDLVYLKCVVQCFFPSS